MFKDLDLKPFISKQSENGWYSVNLHYFDNIPDFPSIVSANMHVAKSASQKLSKRYQTLNRDSRTPSQCPRKGVAVKHPSNEYYMNWINECIDVFCDHYEDIIDAQDCAISDDPNDIDHFASGKHELFQLSKMGMFAPYKKRSLTKASDEYISNVRTENANNLNPEDSEIALSAMDLHKEIDLSDIPDGSLQVVSYHDAVYGANIQGLAGGFIQLARDEPLTFTKAQELSKVPFCNGFKWKYSTKDKTVLLADELIRFVTETEIELRPEYNLVTQLRRIQVGGLDITHNEVPEEEVQVSDLKPAKYRCINSTDPISQINSASAEIAFREACKLTGVLFMNTLYDPDRRWEIIKESVLEAVHSEGTQLPLDFQEWDSRLHADMQFNYFKRVIAPKFVLDQQYLINIVAVNFIYNVILKPTNRGFTYVPLIGGIRSGEPWTNRFGSGANRTAQCILVRVRPDIFFVKKNVGGSNGDDFYIGVYKSAIDQYGMDEIIKIANDILVRFGFKFNENKLISIKLPENNYVLHWEQYAIWYNCVSHKVMRHGSALRYFGKIYSDEDPGRQGALEGLIDQLTSINNVIGYVGDQTFMVGALSLELLSRFIERDPLAVKYINQHGQAFFEFLVKDAVKDVKQGLALSERYVGYTDNQLEETAINKILQHLRAAGFDKDGLTKVIHDKDFSFLSVTRLAGLGSAELHRIADAHKGRMLTYRVSNNKLEWINN